MHSKDVIVSKRILENGNIVTYILPFDVDIKVDLLFDNQDVVLEHRLQRQIKDSITYYVDKIANSNYIIYIESK